VSLRASICGVSGGNKGSADKKIFFCPSTKVSSTEIPILLKRN
jgi:hypothetical protein